MPFADDHFVANLYVERLANDTAVDAFDPRTGTDLEHDRVARGFFHRCILGTNDGFVFQFHRDHAKQDAVAQWLPLRCEFEATGSCVPPAVAEMGRNVRPRAIACCALNLLFGLGHYARSLNFAIFAACFLSIAFPFAVSFDPRMAPIELATL